MPTHKVKGGYKWGKSGKVYPTKAQADKQGQAIYASGWKGHVNEIDLCNNEEKQNVRNKDMKINKNIVRLTESQFKQMISESIKTALKEMVGPEGDYADYIGEDMTYDSVYNTAEHVIYSCEKRGKYFSSVRELMPYVCHVNTLNQADYETVHDACEDALMNYFEERKK